MFRSRMLFASTPCPALLDDSECNVPRCLFLHDNVVRLRQKSQEDTVLPDAPPAPAPPVPTQPVPVKVAVDPRLRRIVERKGAPLPEGDKVKRQKTTEDGDKVPGSGSYAENLELSEDEEDGGVKLETPPSEAPRAQTTAKVTLSTRPKKATPPVPLKPALKRPASVATPPPPAPPPRVKTPPPGPAVVWPVKPAVSPSKQRVKLEAKPSPKSAAAPTVALTLNPRLINRAPATYQVRKKFIDSLHKELTRLYGTPADYATQQEIIKKCLDTEEDVATTKKSIYTNVMKKLIVGYMKQKPDEFAKLLQQEKDNAAKANQVRKPQTTGDLNNEAPALSTGVSPLTELEKLQTLIQAPEILRKYGHLINPPSEAEIAAALIGLEAAGNWEACDHCTRRFQVFPGRRTEDGALTTHGSCTHHPGRSRTQPGTIRGTATDAKWTCCDRLVGTDSGCEITPTHVFKVSDPKRLAAISRFITTPENPRVSAEQEKERALAVDCEMGYTTLGMELIRLTATAWPSGEVVVDALVKPRGDVLDLNSRFSGVFPEMLKQAPAYTPIAYPALSSPLLNPTGPDPASSSNDTTTTSSSSSTPPPAQLPILPSPEAARDALLHYITPRTPLIGHALENDLLVLRLCHPAVVDTSVLYPHTRGLPSRNKLKYLVSTVLKRGIQREGDENGHDSKVDARCAGELVRKKIAILVERERWAAKNGGGAAAASSASASTTARLHTVAR